MSDRLLYGFLFFFFPTLTWIPYHLQIFSAVVQFQIFLIIANLTKLIKLKLGQLYCDKIVIENSEKDRK